MVVTGAKKPNVLITGTPGVEKTTLAEGIGES